MGFERVTLVPGETKAVKFSVPAKDFAYRDVDKMAFIVEPGAFGLMAGSSSADISSKRSFHVK